MHIANDNPEPLFCSVTEAMAYTSLGRTTLYMLIKQGLIASCTVGRRRLIEVASLKALAANG